MKIILLGNKGLVGSTVYRDLSLNHEVIGLDLDTLDLNDLKNVTTFFSENKADVLINLFGKNHHISKNKNTGNNVFNIEESEITDYFHVNVILLFRVCRLFCKFNSTGKIYNFSSLYGHHVPNPNYYNGSDHKSLGYVLSKASVVMLNKYLAVHYPSFNFIDVVLGGVENNQPDSFKEPYLKDLVIKRLLKSSEVSKLIEGLLNTNYVTGSSIFLDGGKHLF
jgi:NAD(P)-dependent dehydrogenase (short-subunit alcohol dehydrogenase family)